MSHSPEPRFARGQRVQLKASGEVGAIIDARRVDSTWEYELFLNSETSYVYPERFLTELVDDESVIAKLKRWDYASPAEFRKALTTIQVKRPIEQNLYSYLASRTELQPYQFKPVLKLLRSPFGRMFIADEVGLGKTIEAGIVMLELAARVALRRVLVVCPPALTRKWHAELLQRFDQEFEILTRQRAYEMFADPDLSRAPAKAIGSLALLRNGDLVEALSESEARFDLVIVDESHHMQNPETAAYRLGEQLSGVADHMLMLSATPLSLSTDNLFHQLSILAPEDFFDVFEFRDRIAPNAHLNQAIRALARPPRPRDALDELTKIRRLSQAHLFEGNPLYENVCKTLAAAEGALDDETRYSLRQTLNDLSTIGHVFTRTRKREVQDQFPARRAVVVKVRLDERELRFYDAVTEFVRREAGEMANFLAVMPQRQVASSIPAAREYLNERWGMDAVVEEESLEVVEGVSDEGDVLAALDDEQWEELVEAWRDCAGLDSKYACFEAAVVAAIEDGIAVDGKVLVFSFFRKTIEHLAARLHGVRVNGADLRVSVLYGPTREEQRHRIVQAFRDEPGPHVVLASEIAAEGLDFEFANVIVNYDLPWNPMRVEQRIGRLDRYGQRSPLIHVMNFSVEDTIEERILERLYTRIGIFEAAIGDLESILGDEIEELTRELLRPGLTTDEEAQIIDQHAENIVRRRDEAEKFERESQELLGQDDVFADQLKHIAEERRYVGPEEIREFVLVTLRERFGRVKYKEVDGVVEMNIPGDGGIRELMVNHLERAADSGRRSWRAVDRARPGSVWSLTFDPQVARRQRELDFITLQHPLVGALLEGEEEMKRPTAAVRIAVPDEDTGVFVLLLYIISIRSFRSGLELLPVAVRADSAAVDESVSARSLSLVRGADDEGGAAAQLDESVLDAAFEAAEGWIVNHVADRERQLGTYSDQLIDRRISSLRDSFERWVTHRRRLLSDAEARQQASIARLHRGYIRRRERELADRVRELDEQRGVQIGRELIAGAVIEVVRATE